MKLFNINKKKIIALATAGIILTTGLTGCKEKNDKSKTELIGFSVTSSTYNNQNGLYSYIINEKGLESKKYDFSSSLRTYSLAKINEEETYGSNILNEKTTAFYRKYMRLVWPECYSLYDNSWFNSSNFDFEIKSQKLNECAGAEFVVIYSSMTAKKDLNLNVKMLQNGKKIISKGDNISSTAIYYEDELVAYKQTGIGSDCKNVINASIGDVDLALKTVENAGLLDKTTEISYDELYQYQEELNNIKQKNK